MTDMDPLDDLKTYAASALATCEGVAGRLNRLDDDAWLLVLEATDEYLPLGADVDDLGRGAGGDGWSVLWWDSWGRRVIARFDNRKGERTAEAEPTPPPQPNPLPIRLPRGQYDPPHGNDPR